MTVSNVPALTLAEAASRLRAAGSVLIFMHQNPDGDAVGSAFALRGMLCAMGKSARVVCADEVPHRLRFLFRGQDDCAYTDGMESAYDLLCAVDTASVSQLGKLAFLSDKISLSIDHHGTNGVFAPHCTVPSASATGELLYAFYMSFVKAGDLLPCADICRLLYAAILSDTGSFKFANTTKDTLLTAAELLGAFTAAEDGGDDGAMLCHRLFASHTLRELYAQRAGIDALRVLRDGMLGVVLFTAEMLDEQGLTAEDVGNIVNIPRSLAGVRIALSVKQSAEDPTAWRVSARAAEEIDVSAVCASFGGGGHVRAAGCTVHAPDADTALAIVEKAFGDAIDDADRRKAQGSV